MYSGNENCGYHTMAAIFWILDDRIIGGSVNGYPIPAVGASLSSLRLSFLQPTIRKGVLVEAI